MRRRKRRRYPSAASVLWGLLLINVAVGLAVSPATACRKLRVVGAIEADRASIITHAQILRNVPCLRVNRNQLESLVLASEDVWDAKFTANLFGSGVLNLKNREAAAKVFETKSLYLSTKGDLFMSRAEQPALPEISVPKDVVGANLCLCSGWESAKLAYLCSLLGTQLPNLYWNVAVDARGVIFLSGRTGGKVALGSSENLDEKVDRLRKVLDTQPDLLESVRELNLTSPAHPFFTPK